MNHIEVRAVTKTFDRHTVLDNVSLSVAKGRCIGLVGANGSGKTMLMRCICGFVLPDKGEVYVDGKQIGKDVDFSPCTGIVIEAPGFLPVYSGLTNLAILMAYCTKKKECDLGAIMRSVGLEPNDRRPLRKYSMGMRQRLGIAQAIMDAPDILILDEPFNSLDKDGVKEIAALLLSLKHQGKTMILAGHHSDDIDLLCDEVYEMESGKISKQTGRSSK